MKFNSNNEKDQDKPPQPPKESEIRWIQDGFSYDDEKKLANGNKINGKRR
ncbi:hypothetical protein ACWV26_11610 [Rummeliibacillus sp. JY-2-4R]